MRSHVGFVLLVIWLFPLLYIGVGVSSFELTLREISQIFTSFFKSREFYRSFKDGEIFEACHEDPWGEVDGRNGK